MASCVLCRVVQAAEEVALPHPRRPSRAPNWKPHRPRAHPGTHRRRVFFFAFHFILLGKYHSSQVAPVGLKRVEVVARFVMWRFLLVGSANWSGPHQENPPQSGRQLDMVGSRGLTTRYAPVGARCAGATRGGRGGATEEGCGGATGDGRGGATVSSRKTSSRHSTMWAISARQKGSCVALASNSSMASRVGSTRWASSHCQMAPTTPSS